MVSASNHNRISWRIKRRFVFEDTPGHPGQLVAMHPFRCSCQPFSKAEVWPSIGSHQDDFRCLNKEHAQISASPL